MNSLPMDIPSPPPGWVADFLQHRIEHALRERLRYRYVHPRVLPEGAGYRIESPCCSRNVDREGGVIDIALLQPVGESRVPGEAQMRWQLQPRDHARQCWAQPDGPALLSELLDRLCVDADRVFWP